MYFIKIFIFLIIWSICIFNLTKIKLKVIYLLINFTLLYFLIVLTSFKYEYIATIVCDIYTLILICLSNKRIIMSIFTVLLANLIYLLSDLTVAIIFVNIFKIDAKDFLSTYYGYIIYSTSVLGITYIFSMLAGSILSRRISFFDLKVDKRTIYYVLSLLSITLLLYYANIISIRNITTNTATILIIEVILIISFFIVVGIVYLLIKSISDYTDKSNEVILKNEELKNLKDYTEKLEIINYEMRAFRHDYINILATIKGYIVDGDIEKLDEYFSNNIENTSRKMEYDNATLGKLNKIEIQSIKGIIAQKIIYAQEKKINTRIEIEEKIENINMGEVDLSRVLGILFDNSIEASLNCSYKKCLEFAIIKKEKSVMIVVRNIYDGELASINILYKKGYSTKGDNRGLGLFILKEILQKYNNVLRETNIKDNWFEQIIEIVD